MTRYPGRQHSGSVIRRYISCWFLVGIRTADFLILCRDAERMAAAAAPFWRERHGVVRPRLDQLPPNRNSTAHSKQTQRSSIDEAPLVLCRGLFCCRPASYCLLASPALLSVLPIRRSPATSVQLLVSLCVSPSFVSLSLSRSSVSRSLPLAICTRVRRLHRPTPLRPPSRPLCNYIFLRKCAICNGVVG